MNIPKHGYGEETYSRESFRATAKRVAQDLPEVMKTLGADVVAVRGKSGVAMAHALAMLADINVVVIRKPAENSHGSWVEGWGGEAKTYIILDDFISSGDTCNAIIEELLRDKQFSVHPEDGMKCVGMFMYAGATSEFRRLTSVPFWQEGWRALTAYHELPVYKYGG